MHIMWYWLLVKSLFLDHFLWLKLFMSPFYWQAVSNTFQSILFVPSRHNFCNGSISKSQYNICKIFSQCFSYNITMFSLSIVLQMLYLLILPKLLLLLQRYIFCDYSCHAMNIVVNYPHSLCILFFIIFPT